MCLRRISSPPVVHSLVLPLSDKTDSSRAVQEYLKESSWPAPSSPPRRFLPLYLFHLSFAASVPASGPQGCITVRLRAVQRGSSVSKHDRPGGREGVPQHRGT